MLPTVSKACLKKLRERSSFGQLVGEQPLLGCRWEDLHGMGFLFNALLLMHVSSVQAVALNCRCW